MNLRCLRCLEEGTYFARTQSSGGSAGWLVFTVSQEGWGSHEASCANVGRSTNWNQWPLPGWSASPTRMKRYCWGEETLPEWGWLEQESLWKEVFLVTQALQSPCRAPAGRIQQGAAGRTDIWFRESQLFVTKQNIEGLVGNWQSTLVTGPMVRLMKHRKGVQKALDSADMINIHYKVMSCHNVCELYSRSREMRHPWPSVKNAVESGAAG